MVACTAINGLQSMHLMSMHGALPAHIRCRSSVQFRHSRRTCRTVCGPYPHSHWSVSALLMAWRYARSPILPTRIYVTTELTARCSLYGPSERPGLYGVVLLDGLNGRVVDPDERWRPPRGHHMRLASLQTIELEAMLPLKGGRETV